MAHPHSTERKTRRAALCHRTSTSAHNTCSDSVLTAPRRQRRPHDSPLRSLNRPQPPQPLSHRLAADAPWARQKRRPAPAVSAQQRTRQPRCAAAFESCFSRTALESRANARRRFAARALLSAAISLRNVCARLFAQVPYGAMPRCCGLRDFLQFFHCLTITKKRQTLSHCLMFKLHCIIHTPGTHARAKSGRRGTSQAKRACCPRWRAIRAAATHTHSAGRILESNGGKSAFPPCLPHTKQLGIVFSHSSSFPHFSDTQRHDRSSCRTPRFRRRPPHTRHEGTKSCSATSAPACRLAKRRSRSASSTNS